MKSTPENTAVTTILAYQGEENIPLTFGFMQASAKRLGIPLMHMLTGQPFIFRVREFDMSFDNKVLKLWDEIQKLPEQYEYILFSDSRDTLFLRPLSVICEAYNKIGWPILISATRNCAHHIDPGWLARFGVKQSGFNYLNSGMWMAERQMLGRAVEKMRSLAVLVKADRIASSLPSLHNNDQHMWQTCYVESSVPIRLDFDHVIFNNSHQCRIDEYDWSKSCEETPVVMSNGSCPSIIHFAGSASAALPFVAWTLNLVKPGIIPSTKL